MHGPLFYWQLQLDKVMALRASKGDFNTLMTLSETSKSDLQWWISHTHTPLSIWYPMVVPLSLFTCIFAWLGWCIEWCLHWGLFSEEEQTNHINYLEILACFLALQTFCASLRDCHIKAMNDNTTTISFIKGPMKRKIICAYLKGLSKYRRMVFFFLKYLFSF